MRHVGDRYDDGPLALLAPVHIHSHPARMEIGQFFRDLHASLHYSPHYIAAFLLTDVRTLEALEAGAVEQLPDWPETERIVTEYANLGGLDPRPVLHALLQISANVAAAPVDAPDSFASLSAWMSTPPAVYAPAQSAQASAEAPPTNRRTLKPRRRAIYAASLPLAMLIAAMNAPMLSAAVSGLPPGVVSIVDRAKEFFIVSMASERAGFRWIEVDDPRSRRGDKLRTTRR